jgi:isopentenyl diphosphate isomerase/L-lactate dehydrogenase-like FMN-dependent dehydrogenase
MQSPAAVRAVIQQLRREFATAMFLLGVAKVEKLKGNAALVG